MSGVKIYRVKGRMLLSHDKFPEWREFTVEVRALKESDAIEKVYSELGSRHKLKRHHVKISSVSEIPLEQAESTYVLNIEGLKGWDRP
ncbi:MAG: 50S ribosomal protein L18a [Desulfurococcales archaeon]|nr:50S ribosomal protein L18a [Desulfurococcales archaeon]MEB3758437.1 50S ribosomal protein L18a [Desulfurococcales archaeon]MEB3772724.1 50S ribosomal protein L18a [Desulfurococcales archaeon]MEB3786572.1 50S ribosomal protein L18a [Desulfurococcales archaeon]MEB3799286.1 50S ribosomal protein L18a [Desulfurococcales archaeon]